LKPRKIAKLTAVIGIITNLRRLASNDAPRFAVAFPKLNDAPIAIKASGVATASN